MTFEQSPFIQVVSCLKKSLPEKGYGNTGKSRVNEHTKNWEEEKTSVAPGGKIMRNFYFLLHAFRYFPKYSKIV